MASKPEAEMQRQLLLHVILFSLLLPEASAAAAAAAQGCSRRCGGLVVPYPFGFSGSCPIMLSCNVDAGNSTAALILQGNHSTTTDRSYTVVDGSFNSTTSTFAASVPPSCNRTVPDAKRWLSGASYGVSSRVGMFLRGSCRTATTTACSVPADAMSKVIRAAQCGGAGGNGTASSSLTCVASIPPNSTAEALGVGLFARWDAVEEPRCDNMLTSFFYGETPEGGGGVLAAARRGGAGMVGQRELQQPRRRRRPRRRAVRGERCVQRRENRKRRVGPPVQVPGRVHRRRVCRRQRLLRR